MAASSENASKKQKPRAALERPVAAASRTLQILDAFIGRQHVLSLGEIAEATGLFKSVILRYMISLEKRNYVRKLDDGRYQLGTKAIQLAHAFEQSLDQRQVIQAALRRLVAATGESAFFYVQDNGHRLCLLGQDSPQSLRVTLRVGASSPLDKTSISQVLMEYQQPQGETFQYDPDMVRSTIGVFDPLTASISAPVFDRSGSLFGALSVSGPVPRFDVTRPDHRSVILAEARDLSRDLGFSA